MIGHNYGSIRCKKCNKIHLHPRGNLHFLKMSKKITPEFSYILGVMNGDGYISKSHNKFIGVGLNCMSKEFTNYFKLNIEKNLKNSFSIP